MQMAELKKTVGLGGAFFMGMGSIVGTGVFVSLGIAAGVTGSTVFLAVIIAAVVATFNGLSTAQLAALMPKSGGTYEYARQKIAASAGFAAGWLFLTAKSASAATAALALSGYLSEFWEGSFSITLAAGAVVVITLIILSGLRRSNTVNIVIVSITILSLIIFIFYGLAVESSMSLSLQLSNGYQGFFEASALMFVAYTGYGRVATLGEEIQNPEKNIPRAVILTLSGISVLYLLITVAALAMVDADVYGDLAVNTGAPLSEILLMNNNTVAAEVLAVGAVTAMFGVLLNLILGLSRVAFAMARNHDLPFFLSRVDSKTASPSGAILFSSLIIISLVLVGDIKFSWSFSAVTVLGYYSLTNLSALRLKESERLYHPVFPLVGLLGCISLAFWVDLNALIAAVTILSAGFIFRYIYRYLSHS